MEQDLAARISAQFKDLQGNACGPIVTLPANATPEQLDLLLNELLAQQSNERGQQKRQKTRTETDTEEHADSDTETSKKFSYFIHDKEIIHSIQDDLKEQISTPHGGLSEIMLTILYQPQALFKVKAVTRCSSTMTGHDESVLAVHFSPDGSKLASGSGDASVRFWDLSTETPFPTTHQRHKSWVLCIAWSPDARFVASGSMDNTVQIWNGATGAPFGRPLVGHTKWITSLVWQPLHLADAYCLVASASKDRSIRIWDPIKSQCLFSLHQHTDTVSCLRWSGEGYIYSGSRDRTIRVWEAATGKLANCLTGHAHWINTMALSTDYTLRTGAFDPAELAKDASHRTTLPSDWSSCKARALELYQASLLASSGKERLITGSDDFTLILWTNAYQKTPASPSVRMNGHQGVISQVLFSPDGRWIASGSFDKSIKLWDGYTGRFVTNFRGHVGPIYQIAWSSDSRLLVSGSRDSTLKVWDMKSRKLKMNLPGHLDEVFAVDWSPDGDRVASGSKDKTLKMQVDTLPSHPLESPAPLIHPLARTHSLVLHLYLH